MRRGKAEAQVAHASMKVFLNNAVYNDSNNTMIISLDQSMKDWLLGSFKKVSLSCDSLKELLEYKKMANELEIPTALITDNGLTEFHGNPTITCLAIGPAEEEDIDLITGDLKLR